MFAAGYGGALYGVVIGIPPCNPNGILPLNMLAALARRQRILLPFDPVLP